MRKVCYLLTWAYFFTVPWDHSLYLGVLGPVSRAVSISAVPFVVVAVTSRGRVRRPGVIHILMIAFLLLAESTYFWTLTPESTLRDMRTFFQVMIVVWLVWEFATSKESRRQLGVAYMLGCYVSIANTFREFAMDAVDSNMSIQRFNAEGWDQNDLAMTLALGIALSRYVAEGATRGVRVLAFCYIPLALVAIALTGSRSGSIVAAIAVLSLAVQWRGRAILKVIVLGGLLAITCLGLTLVPQKTLDRVLTMASDADNMNNRVLIWQAAVGEVPSHLLLGTGAGSFRVASGTGMVAHNTFLSVLTEEGLVGLAIFLAIIVMLFQAVRQGDSSTGAIWTLILVCWCVGVSTLTWEQTRLTWAIFALAAAQSQGQTESTDMPFGSRALQFRAVEASGE